MHDRALAFRLVGGGRQGSRVFKAAMIAHGLLLGPPNVGGARYPPGRGGAGRSGTLSPADRFVAAFFETGNARPAAARRPCRAGRFEPAAKPITTGTDSSVKIRTRPDGAENGRKGAQRALNMS